MKMSVASVVSAVLLVLIQNASAFSPQPFVTSVPVRDENGILLPGNNTNSVGSCGHFADGCLVEILSVGSNNVSHLPNLDGTPSGGDTILGVSYVGDGITACQTNSGEFFSQLSNAPTDGTKIYARVFNAPALSNATYWGQSATFTVTNTYPTMDVSVLGLKATTMPLGYNLMTTLDGKGQTYYTDLIANVNPLNPNDVFATGSLVVSNSQVAIMGHVGRIYTLQRSTSLTPSTTWTNITSTGPLTADSSLILADPSPPNSPNIFYRVSVTMP